MNKFSFSNRSLPLSNLLNQYDLRWGLNLADGSVSEADLDFSRGSLLAEQLSRLLQEPSVRDFQSSLDEAASHLEGKTELRIWREESEELESRVVAEQEQLDRLEAKSDRLTHDSTEARTRQALDLRRVEDELDGLRQKENLVRQDIHSRQSRLNTQQSRLEALGNDSTGAPSDDRRLTHLRQRLDRIDHRVRHWRAKQQEVNVELIRVREALVRGQHEVDTTADGELEEVRRSLFKLEQSAEAILQVVSSDASLRRSVSATAELNEQLDTFKHRLESAYGVLYRTHQQTTKRLADIEREQADGSLRILRRRHRDLGRCIQRLLHRRANVLKQIAHSCDDPCWLVDRSQNGYCYCAGNGESGRKESEEPTTSTRITSQSREAQELRQEIRGLQSELANLAEQRRKLMQEIAALENRCGQLKLKLDHWEAGEAVQLQAAINECRANIHRWKIRIDELRKSIRDAESQLNGWTVARLQIASQILQELSNDRFQQIHYRPTLARFEVADAFEKRHDLRALMPEVQDLIAISLGMALLPDWSRQKDHVVWNVALDRLSSEQALRVAELATERCPLKLGLVITSTAHSLLWQLHDRGYHVIGLQAPHDSPLPTDREPSRPEYASPSKRAQHSAILLRQNNADSEEFPGEFRDQIAREPGNGMVRSFATQESFEAYDSFATELDELSAGLESEENWLEKELSGDVGEFEFHREAHHPPVDHRRTDLGGIKSRNESIVFDAPQAAASERSELGPTARESGQSPLTRDSSIRELMIFNDPILRRLESKGVFLVRDLLNREATLIAGWFVDESIRPRDVEAWQRQGRLRCEQPKLSRFDAAVLSACGIDSSAALRECEGFQLADRIDALRTTAAGQDILRSGSDSELSKLNAWVKSMRDSKELRRFGFHDVDAAATYSAQGHRSADVEQSPSPLSRATSAAPRTSAPALERAGSKANEILKFYLDLTEDVEAAPSIGPKMAEHLEKVGIISVRDLLAADAVDVATRLDHRRVKIETVEAWQKQAEFVCRVPNLRGHDSQLLVACGIDSPEQLAEIDPVELFELIEPFAESREGQKIIRNGKKPDFAEICDWVRWTQHQRNLLAA